MAVAHGELGGEAADRSRRAGDEQGRSGRRIDEVQGLARGERVEGEGGREGVVDGAVERREPGRVDGRCLGIGADAAADAAPRDHAHDTVAGCEALDPLADGGDLAGEIPAGHERGLWAPRMPP